ncbi:transcriptional repressor TraM [Mesorhizobium sp. M0046]|uniref:transcriptional repressor TraM n=1 Tax=Mesorhizobium sp. M0046 TaxID=2956858 RepID=UPI003338B7FA
MLKRFWASRASVGMCKAAPEPARIAYVTAMIDMHVQQMVLSTLLDVLRSRPVSARRLMNAPLGSARAPHFSEPSGSQPR